MAVKGSGGDLRSMGTSGFAILYLDKLERLIARYRGEAFEDEMVGFYPLCAFGENRVAASIDTPLHAFLPFDHVDHLHPDWAIALAASANGQAKLEEFNKKYGRKIIWVPWQRPGFELALMLQALGRGATRAATASSSAGTGCSPGATTQKECYLNSVRTIDQMGEFVAGSSRAQRRAAVRRRQGDGAGRGSRGGRRSSCSRTLRGAVSSNRRVIGHYDGSDDALDVRQLGLGRGAVPDGHELPRSLPAHAHLADVHPVEAGTEDLAALKERIGERIGKYREDYAAYYQAFAEPASPKLRDSNPSVVVIPGLGLFGFGKDKREARITTEFFVNAIHVMAGANALGDCGRQPRAGPLPQVRRPEQADQFKTLPQLRRAAAARGVPHRVLGARRGQAAADAAGARVEPADRGGRRRRQRHRPRGRAPDRQARRPRRRGRRQRRGRRGDGARRGQARRTARWSTSAALDLTSARDHRRGAAARPSASSAASTSSSTPRRSIRRLRRARRPRDVWAKTLQINVTSNFVLAQEAAKVLKAQGLPAASC